MHDCVYKLFLKTKFRYYSFGAILYFCFSAPTYLNIDTLRFLFPCYFFEFFACKNFWVALQHRVSVIREMRIPGQCQWHILVYLSVYYIWDATVAHRAKNWFCVWKNALGYCNQFPLSCSVFRKYSKNKGKIIECRQIFPITCQKLTGF